MQKSNPRQYRLLCIIHQVIVENSYNVKKIVGVKVFGSSNLIM